MSTLRVTEIQSNSTSFNTPVRFETSGGTENGTLIKAWVNFNGQGTISIRADFNVNTITDNDNGDYTVNFSNSLTDANYAVAGFYEGSSAPGNMFIYAGGGGTGTSPTLMTSSQCRVKTESGQDASTPTVTFFR
jgi:hypothetical protein